MKPQKSDPGRRKQTPGDPQFESGQRDFFIKIFGIYGNGKEKYNER